MNDLISRSALIERHCEGCSADVRESCKTDPVCATLMWVVEEPAVDAVPVVRCCECKRRYDADECPMCFLIDGEYHEYTNGNGYCDRGERRNGDG